MRLVGFEAHLAIKPDVPHLDDIIMAIDGATFPYAGAFIEAIDQYPNVITILREKNSSPPLGREPGLGLSIS